MFWLGFLPRLILYKPRKTKSLKSCLVIQGEREEHRDRNEGHLGLIAALGDAGTRAGCGQWHREGPTGQV